MIAPPPVECKYQTQFDDINIWNTYLLFFLTRTLQETELELDTFSQSYFTMLSIVKGWKYIKIWILLAPSEHS